MTNRSITLLRVELAPPDDDQINCARLGHHDNIILFLGPLSSIELEYDFAIKLNVRKKITISG
jgi:hypothetical protein